MSDDREWENELFPYVHVHKCFPQILWTSDAEPQGRECPIFLQSDETPGEKESQIWKQHLIWPRNKSSRKSGCPFNALIYLTLYNLCCPSVAHDRDVHFDFPLAAPEYYNSYGQFHASRVFLENEAEWRQGWRLKEKLCLLPHNSAVASG